MQNVAVLGATGSIGDSTLDVIAAHPDRFAVHTLSAHRNAAKITQLAQQFRPQHVVITDPATWQTVSAALAGSGCEVHQGPEALNQVVQQVDVDLVVAGIVGNAGMASVLAAVQAGKTLLLANKEAIVAAGHLVMQAAAASGARIIPLDSEHNAIYQCLDRQYVTGTRPDDVKSITLTASGGPFLQRHADTFKDITPAEAVAHPKWDMGAKISVDSATLMNKGLEVIEAHWLFHMPSNDIDVVVHPQSIIHSMVNFIDGSVLAQMGCPDMRIPIAHGLGLGQRLTNGADFLDLIQHQQLTFEAADTNKFPCLKLAKEAIQLGGTAPAILNAANEVTVAAFLAGRIRFDQIPVFNDKILNMTAVKPVESLAHLQALDQAVRQRTETAINETNNNL
ncbi:1-deoxy-D-xylulose-5-phosphate reductoisomerase [Marinicella meishanensis]|uniref:1-deoxy-D-xylulose-5-phosphate reductoisomerase n=1 Tax=Marinicella meishanensis TaxID=2873263 RepID=UPI001CC18CDE|nr:1-deoxy-D-xylulose-5-phosphate reductoisomerase [Marinicella sp. NBU2979]